MACGANCTMVRASTARTTHGEELAEQVVEKIVEATIWPVKFELTSRFLRICGIWTCVDAGLNLLGCQCFKDLAEVIQRLLSRESLGKG
jgi:hypothetical protein